MSEFRKIPAVFVGGRTGKVTKAGNNLGKSFVTIDTMEVQQSQLGDFFVRAFGTGEKRTLVDSRFFWADKWKGVTDFSKFQPFDIVNLIVEDVGSNTYVVNIELAESTGICDKLFK